MTMRRHGLVIVVGAIAGAIVGCASEEPPAPTVNAPSPQASVSPGASPNAAPSFAQPLVAQKPQANSALPGLIQSTNATERTKQVTAKIQPNRNPTASLPPNLPKPTVQPRTVPTVSQLPTGVRPQGGAGSPFSQDNPTERRVATPTIPKVQNPPLGFNIPPIGRRTASTPTTASGGQVTGDTQQAATGTAPAIPALPPQPSAELAQAVEVTGVIRVAGRDHAIVRAPNDATSRYVAEGQRVSQGKVLVKRIEMNSGGEPVVVLEENGVEVSKTVGEKAAPGGQQTRTG